MHGMVDLPAKSGSESGVYSDPTRPGLRRAAGGVPSLQEALHEGGVEE